jgi:hypothetical protein
VKNPPRMKSPIIMSKNWPRLSEGNCSYN